MDRVTVVWLDAEQYVDHQSLEEALKKKPPTVITTGWLVGETDDHITLAVDHYPLDGTVNGVNVIPKGMVQDITYD